MKKALLLFVVFTSCFASIGYAEEGELSLVEQALNVSGFRKVIDQASEQIIAAIKDNPGKFPPEFFRKFNAVINDSFRSKDIYARVISTLLDNFNREKLLKVIEFSGSPLGKKMTEFEVEAGNLDAAAKMAAFFNEIKFNPPQPRRMDLVKELNSATGSSEKALEISLAISSVFAKAKVQLLPPQKRYSTGELELQLRQKKEMLRPALEAQTEQVFLYTYRNATDGELSEYIDLIKSDAVKWFNDTTSSSLIGALIEASKRAAQGIVAIGNPSVMSQDIFNE